MTDADRTAGTKAMWEQQYQARIGREALVIASVVGGMSRRAVADQLHVSEKTVRRIWDKHTANWEDDATLRAELQARCRTQVRSLWERAINPKTSTKDAVALHRVIKDLTHEQGLLGNLLHVQVDANVSGHVEVTERREVRVTVVRDRLASLRTAQLEGRLAPIELGPAPQTNGHDAAEHNGSEAA